MSYFDDLTVEETEIVLSLRREATDKFRVELRQDSDLLIPYCKFTLEIFNYIHHPFTLLALVAGYEYIYATKPLYLKGFKFK